MPRTLRAPDPLANEPPCEQAQATRELAAEVRQFRLAVEKAVHDVAPAVVAVAELGEAQRKLCNFIVNNRLKLVAGFLAALIATGAITPSAAEGIKAVLATFGLAS